MEEIVERFNKIVDIMGNLDQEYKTKFEEDTADYLSILDNIVTELEYKWDSYDIPKEKWEMVELECLKQKIIGKSLFAYFWILNECLSKMNKEELQNYQKNMLAVVKN